ncbi:Allantoicase [Ascosphaera pollenicola]|nr:Allantoicase [Ascosphaera pollenicola]
MAEYQLVLGDETIDKTFAKTTNLASSLLGASVLGCSDEWFAAASNLLTPTAPIHRPGVFVHTGAWYDGWETRRHNPGEYDWVVIKLGVPSGSIEAIEVDTAYFVGNFGEKVLVEAATNVDDSEAVKPEFNGWSTILPIQECGPSQRRAWKLPKATEPITHVRVRMYPDGGFARVRLYGYVVPPSPPVTASELEELSSALVGGLSLGASDEHYTPASNIILPGRGVNMGDGWETKRSRGADHVDWAIIALGLPGTISKLEVDTKDFRGNFPREVRVHAFQSTNGIDPGHDDAGWVEILSDKKTGPDAIHTFDKDVLNPEALGKTFTHVKLTLVPDGGVKRFRVFGTRS